MIDEFLDERYPEPPLLPADPAERAEVRLWVWDHDRRLADDYYAFRRGGPLVPFEARLGELDAVLAGRRYLAGSSFSLADVAYVPWVLRARDMLGVDLDSWPALAGWLERLCERPSVAAEVGVVAAL